MELGEVLPNDLRRHCKSLFQMNGVEVVHDLSFCEGTKTLAYSCISNRQAGAFW